MERVSNIIAYFKQELAGVAPDRELVSWAYIVMEHFLGFDRAATIINANTLLSPEMFDKIVKTVEALKTQEPLQYILGVTEFYGLKLKVNKHTLIPRPETEELVNWILKDDFNSALDIGTGSGCIPIALVKHTKALISAIDVSEGALSVAKENAKEHGVKINFLHQDILKTERLENVDVIISNPPYVLESEKEFMLLNVLGHEPASALFVPDNNPLLFYNNIAELAVKALNKGGRLYFEINERFAEQTIAMLQEKGFVNIALKKDINDKDRMIKAIKK